MKARDVMVAPVITVKPYTSVRELAQVLLNNHISAVPVVDDQGKLVGIVSEGDLVRRAEAGTQRRRPWWLLLMTGEETLAQEFGRLSVGCRVTFAEEKGERGPQASTVKLLGKHRLRS